MLPRQLNVFSLKMAIKL